MPSNVDTRPINIAYLIVVVAGAATFFGTAPATPMGTVEAGVKTLLLTLIMGAVTIWVTWTLSTIRRRRNDAA